MAVLVMVAGAGVVTFLSLNDSIIRNTIAREMNESASLALERIVRDIRNSETVDVGQSTLGTSPGVLTLTAGATTTEFAVNGGRLEVSEEGVLVGPLTTDAVSVDAFTAWHYVGANTELVRVRLTLTHTADTASSTRTYYGSAVLRGSYE